MKNDDLHEDNIVYPYIVFKVRDNLFSINSKDVEGILRLPKYEPMPDSPPFISGIFEHRNSVVQMVNLRYILGMDTLDSEYDKFSEMIEARKQDHITWVNELERCIHKDENFTLSTDPHRCKFGLWYDNFKSDVNSVMFHLRKIEEPHRKLHEAAIETTKCSQDCDNCQREECLKKILDRAKDTYMPEILKLLEESKDIFKSTIFHEMVLVLRNNSNIGLLVDEVLSVENLEGFKDHNSLNSFHKSEFISGVSKSKSTEGIILDIDAIKLQNYVTKEKLKLEVDNM